MALLVLLFGGPVVVSLALLAIDLALNGIAHAHQRWRCHNRALGSLAPSEAGGAGVVLITGASSGIGKDCAFAFAARGWSVVLVARTKSALEAVAKMIETRHPEVKAHVVPADLSDPAAAVQSIAAAMLTLSLEVHVLVNNAAW